MNDQAAISMLGLAGFGLVVYGFAADTVVAFLGGSVLCLVALLARRSGVR